MQLNAFFPSLDIGSDPAKIRLAAGGFNPNAEGRMMNAESDS